MPITVNIIKSDKQNRIVLENLKYLLATQSIGFRMLEFSIGVQKGYFYEVSENKAELTAEIISRICHVLNISYDELMREHTENLQWKRKYPTRNKSQVWICPVCQKECYCFGECCYRYCPNCGAKIMK